MCMQITFDYDYKLKYSKRFVRIEKKKLLKPMILYHVSQNE